MNDQEIKKAGETAYPKANQILRGDTSLGMNDFTDEELKSILLTIDGVGRKFKIGALEELIERSKKEIKNYYISRENGFDE